MAAQMQVVDLVGQTLTGAVRDRAEYGEKECIGCWSPHVRFPGFGTLHSGLQGHAGDRAWPPDGKY
jgi:hypothetical protein